MNENTTIDPEKYDIDPRYLNETFRPQQMTGAQHVSGDPGTGEGTNGSFAGRFESVNAWPPGWSAPTPLGGLPRLLAEQSSGQAGPGSPPVSGPGARAVPFAPANPLVPEESDASFEERFKPALAIRWLSSRLPRP